MPETVFGTNTLSSRRLIIRHMSVAIKSSTTKDQERRTETQGPRTIIRCINYILSGVHVELNCRRLLEYRFMSSAPLQHSQCPSIALLLFFFPAHPAPQCRPKAARRKPSMRPPSSPLEKVTLVQHGRQSFRNFPYCEPGWHSRAINLVWRNGPPDLTPSPSKCFS